MVHRFIFNVLYGAPFWGKVEILLWTVQIYYQRLIFYHGQSKYIMKRYWEFIMNGWDFMMTDWNLLRMVGIFVITGWDFPDDRSRFQWWQVEIFMMADQGFHNDKSRFSWQQVEVFMMAGRNFEIFMMMYNCFG